MGQVPTACGANAVQVMYASHGKQRVVEHVGSAHDERSWTVAMGAAKQHKADLQEGAQQLALQLPDDLSTAAPLAAVADAQPRMVGTKHRVLWEVLAGVYDQLGFNTAVDSAVFKQLEVAQLIEPVSELRSLEIRSESRHRWMASILPADTRPASNH